MDLDSLLERMKDTAERSAVEIEKLFAHAEDQTREIDTL